MTSPAERSECDESEHDGSEAGQSVDPQLLFAASVPLPEDEEEEEEAGEDDNTAASIVAAASSSASQWSSFVHPGQCLLSRNRHS